jgi:hypothetical protein
MARLEAASVPAFRRLRRELVAHGAPRRLVRAAERAARDEIRHARMTTALARRYGGTVVLAEVDELPVRNLEAIAIENAIEGCVREAFGALVGSWQAAAATDPVIRAVMKRIARDETRHAALAFELHAWLKGRLGADARARLRDSRRDAFRALVSYTDDLPLPLRATLGLPTQEQSHRLAEHTAQLAA